MLRANSLSDVAVAKLEAVLLAFATPLANSVADSDNVANDLAATLRKLTDELRKGLLKRFEVKPLDVVDHIMKNADLLMVSYCEGPFTAP